MIEVITPIDAIITRVNTWAKHNVPNDYYNSSRRVYFRSALTAGIITRDEYDVAEKYYGNLWTYVGD
jgi:hypothetical protein